jgi:site-specific recombinase XerD
MTKRGESLKTVQGLLGHEDISTTENIYVHVIPNVKAERDEYERFT